jgi:exodeoxyribonuclease VII small subunit
MDLSQISYEDALAQLRTIVDQLERGSLGLEQSLELYEQGVELTRFCEARLVVVEERMKVLSPNGPVPTPESSS